MRRLSVSAAALAAALLASCVPKPAPPPVPPPAPAPPPPPTPAPPPPVDWVDAPLSPGDWSYRGEGSGSVAAFGPASAPSFLVRCEPVGRIALERVGASGGNALTVRTTYGERAIAATSDDGGLTATLAAADPLLDQMVFSRGRFAIEAPGTAMLIIPAWPEPARVIEDCRG